ncbi:MAG TPA: DUF2087 domain-containing protein [Acidimicrobiales bacterium]|nr:DUF2087 domain-containing protein [Acidimicrobiales bacterium]
MDLVGLLADGDRLRVFAAVVLGHESVADIREVTGLDARAVGAALARLVQGGLLSEDKLGYHVEEAEIRMAARQGREEPPSDETNAVLRAFFKDGRLQSIPAAHGKRQVVLDVLAQDFEPGKRYTEKQVNLLLGKRFADTAALRRYLVDEGFLDREGGAGRYWRAGGTFEP